MDEGSVVGGRYRLTRLLGAGGLGRVWLAHDEVQDRDVAVKTVAFEPWSAQQWQRFERELAMASRVVHPNVLRILDAVRLDDQAALVTEYLPYPNLQQVLRDRGALDVPTAARIGVRLASALAAVNDAGIVHHDVKPANILVGGDDRVVLVDFGMAELITESGLPNRLVIGTPAYLAPERIASGGGGAAGDIWALGVTLFEAVEGRRPWAAAGPAALMDAALHAAPAAAVQAGPLAPVLERMLQKDPKGRPSAAEVARVLERIVDGLAAADHLAADAVRAGPSIRRGKSATARPGVLDRLGLQRPRRADLASSARLDLVRTLVDLEDQAREFLGELASLTDGSGEGGRHRDNA